MSRHRKIRGRSRRTTADLRPTGRIAEQYEPPGPRQIPELRGQLASWISAEGQNFYLVMALAGRQWLPPGLPFVTGAAQVARQEHTRVTNAELYWVSGPMTDLARHAAGSLPARDTYRHDLPSPVGLMVFETPLASYVNAGGRNVQIVAVTWGPWNGPSGAWDHGGTWLSFYSHPAPVLPAEAFADGFADLSALGPLLVPLTDQPDAEMAMLGPVAETLPPILPDNETGWPFGQLSDGYTFPEGTTAAWALALRAAWRLMKQPLAVQDTEHADRGARRRLARAGLPDAGVRVVRVRRPQRAATHRDPAGGGREYDVQWWVSGHWRRYWCGPGRTRPEDRWISPHLAGPDEKPVRGTERVQVWDR
jgi:hypothetical protein